MFDLDGTLANTGRDLANSVNYVRSRLDLEPLEDRLIYDHVGHGVEHLIRSSLPEKSEDGFRAVMEMFLEHYERHLLDTTALYPRVTETLDYFKRKRRVVVSNKLARLTMSILRGLAIRDCFDVILGGDSIAKKKPDPEPLNQVLSQFDISPRRALMVGDSAADIEAGKQAGVYTCGVTYGLCKKGEIVAAKPDFLIDDLYQLTEHFC